MLLKIVHENNNTVEIEIANFCQVKELKSEVVKRLNIDEMIFESHSDFIYNNFILNEDKILKFYHIESGNKVWAGKIENYLKKDEIILEVFIGKSIPELIFLIVKVQNTISDIISILETILSNIIIIDIWSINGDNIGMDKCVCEIYKENEYQKILLNLSREVIHSFDDCCKIHDHFFLQKYCMNYQDDFLHYENCFFMIPEKRIITEDFLKYVMGPHSHVHKELDNKMSDVMKSVQNSKFLFSIRMTDRIFCILKRLWKSMEDDFEKKKKFNMNPFDIYRTFDRFDDYLQVSLLMSVITFHRNRNGTGADKSIRNIVEDATKYLTCRETNWNTLVKNYLGEFISKTFDWQEALKSIYNFPTIEWKTADGHFDIVRLPKHVYTIGNLKEEVSKLLGEAKAHLYFIKDGETQQKDEDIFDLDETKDCHIIIISSMDDIEILKKLGEGAFAKVKLCKNKLSGLKFALKIPFEKDINAVLNEVSIFNRVKYSPPMISFHGIYFHSNVLCIAMEYIHGKTLESVLEMGNLDISLKFRFVFQILQQIRALHDQGIIHRDISCNNIIVDIENQDAKLIDFENSKSNKESNQETVILHDDFGTLWYKAPELINDKQCSNKSDIWAFGVVAFKIFAGKRPYHTLTLWQFFTRISNYKTIELDPEMFSKDLIDFLSQCFKPDPKERPTVDELLNSSLIQINCSRRIPYFHKITDK